VGFDTDQGRVDTNRGAAEDNSKGHGIHSMRAARPCAADEDNANASEAEEAPLIDGLVGDTDWSSEGRILP